MLFPPPTARLEFSLWHQDDQALAEAIWCDPDVMSHMGGPLTVQAARDRLAAQIKLGCERGVQYWPLRLRTTEKPIGCSGLRPWGEQPQSADLLELGCHVMRSGWGMRLGEEACRGVLAYAFDQLGLATVVAGHKVTNLHSRSLLGRLGFQYTHQCLYQPGGFEVKWYALTEPEWWASHNTADVLRPADVLGPA